MEMSITKAYSHLQVTELKQQLPNSCFT